MLHIEIKSLRGIPSIEADVMTSVDPIKRIMTDAVCVF